MELLGTESDPDWAWVGVIVPLQLDRDPTANNRRGPRIRRRTPSGRGVIFPNPTSAITTASTPPIWPGPPPN
ncbi:MAG: hypothetical protein MZV65_13665 [Chromatiales bacterium]|nr:hypothetical protein [Chromatiales bacterium]